MTEGTNEIVGAVMHMKKNGMLKLLILGFVIGIVLLIVGSLAFSDEKKEGGDSASEQGEQRIDFHQYKEGLRQEIEDVCSGVSGVRDARAVVFFDGMGESVYAKNTQSGSVEKTEYVIVGSGSNSHALYVGESLPPLSGIGVVCVTGGNVAVRNEIAALLSATYGLPMTRIYVSEGK